MKIMLIIPLMALCVAMVTQVATVELYQKNQLELQKLAPELFKVDGVIVTFGSEDCLPCRRQALELKGPSVRYNVAKYRTDDSGRGEKIAKFFDIKSVPHTLIVERGKIRKEFIGYTSWGDIRKHAGVALKSDRQGRFKLGPLEIDW